MKSIFDLKDIEVGLTTSDSDSLVSHMNVDGSCKVVQHGCTRATDPCSGCIGVTYDLRRGCPNCGGDVRECVDYEEILGRGLSKTYRCVDCGCVALTCSDTSKHIQAAVLPQRRDDII